MTTIQSNSNVKLGVVPTHLMFVGGLVPDENGKIPRDGEGNLIVAANMEKLVSESSAKISCVQVPYFPGLDESDIAEMVASFKKNDLEVHFILMVGGADPMEPADEDAVVEMLVGGLTAAKKHGVAHVSSTSVEAWMQEGAKPKTGAQLEAAIAQNVKVHARAAREADVDNSCIEAWHIEFLRGGEFQTFTDVGKIWKFVSAANRNRATVFQSPRRCSPLRRFRIVDSRERSIDQRNCSRRRAGNFPCFIQNDPGMSFNRRWLDRSSANGMCQNWRSGICVRRTVPSRGPGLGRASKLRLQSRYRYPRWQKLRRSGTGRSG